ncbi:MAG TPA: prenyltransferase/squalene oxidase repeat-containing protein [bacterium]|jgi:squalene-hopene/tetraprenyl-beta-curcumene cyclase|nr:prenyltransferase/squalene oxidase repeat-containing protein [bacterium]
MLTRPPAAREAARRAVAVGAETLLDLQHADGRWEGIVRCDPAVTAMFLLVARYVGGLSPAIEDSMLAHLDTTQLVGGGWALYPGGPASLDATLLCYAALRFAGRDMHSDPMRRARAVILAGGGLERVGFIPRTALAFWGQIPLSGLPYLSPKLLFLPRWIHPNFFDLGILLTPVLGMELLLKRQAAKRPAAGVLEELRTGEPFPRAVMSPTGAAVSWVSRVVDAAVPAQGLDRRAADWLAGMQNPDGLWAGMAFFTVRAMMALHAMDPLRYRPHIEQSMAAMIQLQVTDPGGTRWQALARSPALDTAIAVAALLDAGVTPDDPRIVLACRWLLTARGTAPGWSFAPANTRTPDTDTTLHVLEVLARAPRGLAGLDEAIETGTAWLLQMQDLGGWAMWSPGSRFRRSLVRELELNGAIDTSTPDVTARIVRALVQLRVRLRGASRRRTDAAIARAVSYLSRTQRPDGAWPGRWAVNFGYGSAQGLTATAAAGHSAAAARARGFLLEIQQSDGGWGESADSDDAGHFVPAASTTTQTSLVMLGLLAARPESDAALTRAAAFLLERQRDGRWDDETFCQTMLPGRLYFQNSLLAHCLAVAALGRVVVTR